MARDKKITLYVEQEKKDDLAREANDRNLSLSEYILQLVDQSRLADTQEDIARERNAEERLEAIVAQAKDELAQIAANVDERNRALADMNAKLGVYAIANWELLKPDVSDTRRQDALAAGRRRLRDPLADHADLLTEDGESALTDESTAETIPDRNEDTAGHILAELRGETEHDSEPEQEQTRSEASSSSISDEHHEKAVQDSDQDDLDEGSAGGILDNLRGE